MILYFLLLVRSDPCGDTNSLECTSSNNKLTISGKGSISDISSLLADNFYNTIEFVSNSGGITINQHCMDGNSEVSDIIFRGGDIIIKMYAFYETSIKYITIDSATLELNQDCFVFEYSDLRKIDLQGSVKVNSFKYFSFPYYLEIHGSIEFSKYEFLQNNYISRLMIYNSISFPDNCFENCGLTEVDINNNAVVSFGVYCFSYCTDMYSFDGSGGTVSNIGDYCFKNCSNLNEVIINDGYIGKYAFHNAKLNKATFNSVSSFGDYCFLYQGKSKTSSEIIIHGSPSFGENCFYNRTLSYLNISAEATFKDSSYTNISFWTFTYIIENNIDKPVFPMTAPNISLNIANTKSQVSISSDVFDGVQTEKLIIFGPTDSQQAYVNRCFGTMNTLKELYI